jgi:hypothetical protein
MTRFRSHAFAALSLALAWIPVGASEQNGVRIDQLPPVSGSLSGTLKTGLRSRFT